MCVLWLLAALVAFLPAASSAVSAQTPSILGVWSTDKNKSRVEIANCSPPKQGLCGTIIWLSEPNDAQGKPQTDKRNKNASLRGNPIVGLHVFEGWRPAGKNAWKGKVYDPEEGETYDVDITLRGDKLTLKGCVLFVCDSETWSRYRG
jgi:uncharacterized protein (DUF2147 family)